MKRLSYTDFAKLAETLPYLKPVLEVVRRDRPYKIPKGFLSWEKFSTIIAFSTYQFVNGTWNKQDLASQLNSFTTALWYAKNAPIYLLSTSLLREFQETDILGKQELFKELPSDLPIFIIVLPDNAIKTPRGDNVGYILVHISDKNARHLSEGEVFGVKIPYLDHKHEKNLHWSFVDDKETVWFSGKGVLSSGELWSGDEPLGSIDKIEGQEEWQFIDLITNIVLQAILTIEFEPGLVDECGTSPSLLHSTNRPTTLRSKFWQPRWLGKTYQRQNTSNKQSSLTNQNQTRHPHWRRSHWKRVPVGKREENRRKWVKIKATFVCTGL